jgi:hypothetical protein
MPSGSIVGRNIISGGTGEITAGRRNIIGTLLLGEVSWN